jgi:farnesyl diphosphate synthase
MVAQDALDGAELRRGRASWPAHCGLGLRAVNDAALLETGLYQLLKLHFRSHPHYLEILELFHDVIIIAETKRIAEKFSPLFDIREIANYCCGVKT